jgi:threonine dehydrogenase-like Zn-dependent dehydrogenase
VRAAQLSAPREPRVVELDRPPPGPGHVLVKVLACGVCGSDLNAWRGVEGIEFPLAPGLPGHEVWGEVTEVGVDVAQLAPGQRVTGMMQAGYAQYALAAAGDLVALPPALAEAPLLGEPLACAANVVRRVGWQPGLEVAVVGFGYIAALIVQQLFAGHSASWIAISRRPESRALAEQLGAAATYPFEAVPNNQWDRYPIVIEATGVQQALDYATWLTAYGGRLVIAGYHADGPRTVNMQSWNWKGIDVVNAHERKPEVYVRGLHEAIERVLEHHLNASTLVSHRWPLSELGTALSTADARPRDYVKGLVLPWA